MVRMTVKPEAASEYDNYVKKVQAAAAKIGAPRALVYQHYDTYNFVVPFDKGDEVAVWPNELLRPDFELVKAYGEAEARHIEQSSFHGITKGEYNDRTVPYADGAGCFGREQGGSATAVVAAVSLGPLYASAHLLRLDLGL